MSLNAIEEEAANEILEYCDSNSKNYYVDSGEAIEWLKKKGFTIDRKIT